MDPIDTETIRQNVLRALASVRDSRSGKDVVKSGHVGDLEVDDAGHVRFSFTLTSGDPGSLARDAREAAEGADGVMGVKVNVQLPQATSASDSGGSGQRGLKPGSVPAPTPAPGLLPDVKHVIAVSSGKGGVGKSMVASNLAAAFARKGQRVGLLDADIYGPNIPIMFGESRRPSVTGEKGKEMIEPLEAHGVRLMSLGFLLEKEQPAIMRGPLISGILKQFLEQVSWGPLDTMVVDMPPGTGDAQLSLVQTIDLEGVVMVTTPQAVATGDVRRGVKMFERVNTPVMGIVENMRGFVCPSCSEEHDLFGRGGGEELAEELGLAYLGSVPLDPRVRLSGDEGEPMVNAHPESPAGVALLAIADRVIAALS